MRTLVIGIPLPHVSFDNYSFVSAPAISEYERLVVDPAAVSGVIEEVATGAAEHRNFAGQLVRAGPSTASSFGLADLLRMRRREAEWFFGRGGTALCFAHPDVAHPAVGEDCGWRRYSWLPQPSSFSYEQHLHPGFGAPGVELTDDAHPFATLIAEFGSRLAYRATVDESAEGFAEYGRVFARNRAGAAVAAELTVGRGSIVFVPPPVDPRSERGKLAQTLFSCFERLHERAPDEPPSG